MRTQSGIGAMLFLLGALTPAQQSEAPLVTRESLLDHYARAERELRAAPLPADLARASARLALLDQLRAYRMRGIFGINDQFPDRRQPYFIDHVGTRCAVAFLLDQTGTRAITREVAANANGAWVADLAGSAEFRTWLDAHGLTIAEAARIQAPGIGGCLPRRPLLDPEPPRPRAPSKTPKWDGPADAAAPRPRPGTGTRPAARTPAGPMPSSAPARGTSTTRAAALPTVDLNADSWVPWLELQRSRWLPPRPLPRAEGDRASDSLRPLAIELCRAGLRDADPRVRAAAALSLGRMGSAGTDLRENLDDPVYEVRCATVVALASAGTPAAVHALLPFVVQEQDPALRPLALAALGGARHQDGAVARMTAELLAGSHDPLLLAGAAANARLSAPSGIESVVRDRVRASGNAGSRALLAMAIGPCADAPTIAALTEAAAGPSFEVRRSAASALGRTGATLALPALQTAFELERDLGTRAQILVAIGEHGGAAAREFLSEQMRSGKKALRSWAAVALGIWGRGRVDAPLAAAVRAERMREHSQDAAGLWLLALGLLRDPDSELLLAERAERGETASIRTAALLALALTGSARRTGVLAALVREDSCPCVRAAAADALAATAGAAATPILTEAARHSVAVEVSAAAAFALGATGDPEASAALRGLALPGACPTEVRAAALAALGRLHAADARLLFAPLGWRGPGTLPDVFAYLAQLDR